MNEFSSLIEKNNNKKRKLRTIKKSDKTPIITINSTDLDSTALYNLLTDVRKVIKIYGKSCKELVINIPFFYPKDKLVYILIEVMIYTLIVDYNINVDIRSDRYRVNINNGGLRTSSLMKGINNGIDNAQFVKEFKNVFVENHFRRVLDDLEDDLAVSTLVTDIKTFLYKFHMKSEFDANLALIVGELADNAYDHAKSECLIDIDISEEIFSKKEDDNTKNKKTKYYAINVVVLNIGDKCIYSDIDKKMQDKNCLMHQKYNKIKETFDKHKNYFNKNYNEQDFFIITSFQDGISGRPNEFNSGGKGLPELVRTLEEFADDDYCYVLSGNNVLMFCKELLNYTHDGWIGFNKHNDFLNEKPDTRVIDRSDTYLPGTGYNLTLIFKGDELDG